LGSFHVPSKKMARFMSARVSVCAVRRGAGMTKDAVK
jgi:hypothetical protein